MTAGPQIEYRGSRRHFGPTRYRNRRIGEFFKELDMTEGRGTGVPKIRAARKRTGSPRPKFETDENRLWFVTKLPIHMAFRRAAPLPDAGDATAQVTAQAAAMLKAAKSSCTRDELQSAAGITHREHFRKQYLLPLLAAGLIEMTIPDKPRSSLQRYRTTAAGGVALRSQHSKS